MAYRIEVSNRAKKSLRKLDRKIVERVFDELEFVSTLDNPRSRGKALEGDLKGLWRYRVGDYRIICDIEDGVMVVLVVEVGHRSRIYDKR